MTILRRITRDQFTGFLEDHYQGKYPHLRIGQAFLNRFYPYVSDPEGFYSDDEIHTVDYIEQHYVQPEEKVA